MCTTVRTSHIARHHASPKLKGYDDVEKHTEVFRLAPQGNGLDDLGSKPTPSHYLISDLSLIFAYFKNIKFKYRRSVTQV